MVTELRKINISAKNYSGYTPAMLIAKTAEDFTYLPFNNTRVNLQVLMLAASQRMHLASMHLCMPKEIFIVPVKN